MMKFGENWKRYAYAGFLVVISLVGAWLGAYNGDTVLLRAGVFFLVAGVLLAELLAIVGRTPDERWDGLNISMAFFRLSVVNYIATLAIQASAVQSYPLWWWTSARTVMGIFGVIALYFMAREDVDAWNDMTKTQRFRAILVPALYILAILGVAFFW